MPGVNIFIKSEQIGQKTRIKCNHIQNQMLHLPNYSYKSVLENDFLSISYTSYESYPMKVFRIKDFVIVLEGYIYNMKDSDLEKRVTDIAFAIRGKNTPSTALEQFLGEADGEFVIVIFDNFNSELNIINDSLGRLPLYYYHDKESLIVSREIKFIVPFLKSPNLNKDALMEFMLFGFPFSENTLMDNIFRLKPATQLSFDPKGKRFFKKEISRINFDDEVKHSRRTMVKKLKNMFMEGLKNRVEKTNKLKPLIALSGGLDSRATLAGLQLLNVNPQGITIPEGGEEKYAEEVAKDFEIDLIKTQALKTNDNENYKRIVFLKDGLNPCSNSGMVGNLTELSVMFGEQSILYTGLYGGAILRHPKVTSGLRTEKDLAKYLMNSKDNYVYDSENVCKMLNLSKSTVLKYLTDYFLNYKENDIHRKYVHFKYEKEHRWAAEGEDRNRFFFWTITPFLYSPFLQYTLSISENNKDTLFFREFLSELDSRACNTPYYNIKMSLKNKVGMYLLRVSERIAKIPKIRSIIQYLLTAKRNIKKNNTEQIENVRKLLLEMLNDSKSIEKYLSSQDTISVIKNEDNIVYLLRILTVFLYIDFTTKWHKAF